MDGTLLRRLMSHILSRSNNEAQLDEESREVGKGTTEASPDVHENTGSAARKVLQCGNLYERTLGEKYRVFLCGRDKASGNWAQCVDVPSILEKQEGAIAGSRTACVCETAIWQHVKTAWWDTYGGWCQWRRFVPFYGVVDVREIEFFIHEKRQTSGQYFFKIKIEFPDIEGLKRKEEDCMKENRPTEQTTFNKNIREDSHHSNNCKEDMRLGYHGVRRESIKSSHKLKKLSMLDDLTKCFRDPVSAHACDKRILSDGMALVSCLYEKSATKDVPTSPMGLFYHSDKYVGLYVIVGLKVQQLKAAAPLLVLAAIGLVAVWKVVSGDWTVAFAAATCFVMFVSPLIWRPS